MYLLLKPTGGKSWLLRVQVDGKRRDVGLGTANISPRAAGKGEASPIVISILHRKVLTLSEAREKAGMLRVAAKSGLDPVAERDRERRTVPTFRSMARDAHDVLREGWPDKGAATFISSLENHVFPTLGDRRVDGITAGDRTAVLSPIWTTKPDMARKVRQRIGTVLNFAHGKDWRSTEAPGRSVTVGLPRQPKGGNYAAMPYADVPTLVAKLQAGAPTSGRLLVLFQIMTAARPSEAQKARWGQINMEAREWKRPADIMKTGEEHTVTLSSAAVAVLERARAGRTVKPDELLFSGRGGKLMSDMIANKVLKDAGHAVDAHGFRSSFRDWPAEKMPDIPDPVAEAALAHVVPDKVVRAYKRTTFLDLRRELLEAWEAFVFTDTDAEV